MGYVTRNIGIAGPLKVHKVHWFSLDYLLDLWQVSISVKWVNRNKLSVHRAGIPNMD